MKKELLLFSIFLILLCSLYSTAQSIKTDYGVYPPPSPPPALPAAGATFMDPVFGTTIMRVTDSNDGDDNHQSYSYWPSINKNSSLLYISSVGGNPTLYDFDTATFSISNKRALFQSNPLNDGTPNAEDAIWSGTQNNEILCHTGQKIYRYNVVTDQYTLIKDFSSAYPDIHLWQMSRSINDNVFAFTYKENVNYANIGYIIYRVTGNQTDTASTSDIDEVQLDKAGDYLVIKTGNSGPSVIETEILNIQTGNSEYLTDNAPDFSPGHSDNGTGFVIGADNWNNTYTYRNLATPHTSFSVLDFNNDWTLGNHVSMLSDDESWMLMSTFVGNTTTSSGIFVDEIFQFASDGSKTVRRLAHTHSDYLNQNPNNSYWSMPRANISRDGKYAVFTSNWGSTTRMDVFILKIAPLLSVGIVEEENISFGVFPNPTTGVFTIRINKLNGGAGKIFIKNIVGEIVFQQVVDSDEKTLHLDLANGIYLVELSTNKGRIVQKLSCVK